jgi:hypothetical protein
VDSVRLTPLLQDQVVDNGALPAAPAATATTGTTAAVTTTAALTTTAGVVDRLGVGRRVALLDGGVVDGSGVGVARGRTRGCVATAATTAAAAATTAPERAGVAHNQQDQDQGARADEEVPQHFRSLQ